MKAVTLAITFAVTATLASRAAASILISNLDEPLRSQNDISSTLWAAQGFVTDGNVSRLINIRANVGSETGPVLPFAELRRADEDGNMDTSPDGLIVTLTPPDMAGPRDARTFTPDSPVLLAPNTKYYFLVGNTSETGDTFEWSYANTNVWDGPGYFDQYEYTFDGGASWQSYGYDFPFHMEVNTFNRVPQFVVPERIGG